MQITGLSDWVWDLRNLDVIENSSRVKGIRSCFRSAGPDISSVDGHVTSSAVQQREMLFTYGVGASAIQSFDLFMICRLEGSKWADIARLSFWEVWDGSRQRMMLFSK